MAMMAWTSVEGLILSSLGVWEALDTWLAFLLALEYGVRDMNWRTRLWFGRECLYESLICMRAGA